MNMKDRWKPLARSHSGKRSPALIEQTMRDMNVSREEAEAFLTEYDSQREYWVNDIYQVQVHRVPEHKLVHLNIRRRDGKPIFRDWRHFQRIKNELVGPECEAVELYPAESRLIDSSNKYHLWCVSDPTFRFPVGFNNRDVSYIDTKGARGMRQRPDLYGLDWQEAQS